MTTIRPTPFDREADATLRMISGLVRDAVTAAAISEAGLSGSPTVTAAHVLRRAAGALTSAARAMRMRALDAEAGTDSDTVDVIDMISDSVVMGVASAGVVDPKGGSR